MTEIEKIKFIENAIEHLFKRVINVKPSDKLLDLALDSLDIVELQMYYEEVAGIELNENATISTVNDLMMIMK